ncbi:MAG: hypothetical protein BLITH_0531 [Brockia lithotrophica]|uniref:Prenylated flavin chaperone LpdD-like domain-containing protein n=1 Tax=Brockia lithotrophica TaxID=933949 RepID=A0A2T5G4I4_9BACL|nr:hypothetical protein [Brockia lithotrophica]MBT9253316.1 hypothetical protein [Brockia lithotrophica]PTQ51101.1 MAG: hypothetical protein BLITH_0531 [Brockia lithotrophica]
MNAEGLGMPLRFSCGDGPYRVEALLVHVGEDLVVVVGGGTRPHVGAVEIAVPEGPGSSVRSFLREGHREDVVVKRLLQAIGTRVRGAAVVTAGIHIDAATPEEIRRLLAHVDCLAEDIARYLEGNLRAADNRKGR